MLLELRLGVQVGPHMTRPWFHPTGAEPTQIPPAQLTTDWSRKGVGDPLCDRAPILALVLRRGLAQHHQ